MSTKRLLTLPAVLMTLLSFLTLENEFRDPFGFAHQNVPHAKGQSLLLEQLIYDQVNAVRLKHGLNPVSEEINLRQIARDHSLDMLERGFFLHKNPEGKGPADRVAEKHRRLVGTTAENLWWGIRGELITPGMLAVEIMESLMNSPGHRANILRNDATHLGVGVSMSSGEKLLSVEITATQLFALVKAYSKEPIPRHIKWGSLTNFLLISGVNEHAVDVEFVELWSSRLETSVSGPLPLKLGRFLVPSGNYQLRFLFRNSGSSTFTMYPGPLVSID